MIGQRGFMVVCSQVCLAKGKGGFCGMSKNTVTFLDRLLAIPVAIYFWWHEQGQKLARKAAKKDS